MKHFFTTFMAVCCLFLMTNTANAQNTLTVPNGEFTSWEIGNGYSISIAIGWGTVTVPAFNDFPYPSEWNYPVYPIDYTFPYGGQDVNINVNLPLLKASPDTINAANDDIALKIESFKLSDIFIPSFYSFVQSSFGEMADLTIPTILTNANIQEDQFFNLLELLSSNLDSTSQFLSNLSDVDLNDYLQGGMAVNEFVPGKLIGQYKYTSAEGGDNGAVLILGSRYNSELNRREVVGGGINVSLSDTPDFTPFEVIYHASNEFDASLPHYDADTLCFFLISSASDYIQQYSALYVDNLVVTEYDSTEVLCASPYFIAVTAVDTVSATLNWVSFETPNSWDVEYGLHGFTLGTGTSSNLTDEELTLTGLQPDTYYDVYIRGVCDDGLYGNWALKTFKTNAPEIPESIQLITDNNVRLYPNPAHGNCTLQFDTQLPTSVKLYAIDGKLLQTLTPTNNSLTLSLPYSGIFMLHCECENGVIVKKIINF